MWFIFFFVLLALSIYLTAEMSDGRSDNILTRFGRELASTRFRPPLSWVLTKSISTQLGYFSLGLFSFLVALLGGLYAIRSVASLTIAFSNQLPTITQKIGIVGFLSVGLGTVGLLIASERWIALFIEGRKVAAQLKRDSANQDNPLGRVLAAYDSSRSADTETIELKLSEAALKEMPGLTKGLQFIKVITIAAPLMALLGTVTGMTKVFQAVTLSGVSDPKMLAGGIADALMMTVLGLVVAIPMVLIHTLVSGKSRKIVNILQKQSALLVAQHSEKHV